MKNYYSFLFFLFFSVNIFAQIPAGYYDSANGLSGAALKAALNNIISGQTVYPYTSTGTDVWDILKETDKDPNNPDNVILLYTGWSVNAAQEYNSGSGWSREHCWPKSHGFPLEEQPAYTDCHHLRPADISVNSARNSRWYAECNEQYFDAGGTIPTDSWTSSTEWVWKPRDAVKGDCARMIFYMATRYEGAYNTTAGVTEPDLEILDFLPADDNSPLPEMAKLSDLLAWTWNEQDPVDDFERNRNEVVYSFQGNRNPYIDHPEYVCLVFGSNCPGTVSNPDPFTAAGVSPTQIDLNWGLNANSDNIVVAWNTTNTFGTPSGLYNTGDLISGGGTVLYVGNATNFSHTGLAQQTYYYKIWSYDVTPEYSSGVEASATPLLPEPANDPTNFTVTGTTFSTIDLSWIDASSGTLPAGYLIKASTSTISDPVDGIPEADGTLIKNISQGVQAVSFTGLSASTTYNFKIYPYTNSGANIDYKTDTPLSTSGTTDAIPLTKDIIYIQDFDLNTSWTYTHDIPFWDNTWGTDGYYGIIDISAASPLNYINFSQNILGENDMNDEGLGTGGIATVDFTDADISLYTNVELSFDWDISGYNASADNAEYEIFYDGVSQGRTYLVDGGVTGPDGEGTVSVLIPDNVSVADLRIYIEDDGVTGFSGFDNFKLEGYPVSVTYTWQGDDPTNPNDWQTAENWDKGSIPGSSDNVIIPTVTNYPVIDDGTATALCKNLTINDGSITIAYNGQLTVFGQLTNNVGNSGIVIQSNATGEGSLIINTAGISATVEKFVTGNNWHLLYPSLSAVPTSIFTNEGINTNYNLYSYNEAKEDYWDVTDIYGTTGWTSEVLSSNLRTDKGFLFNRYNSSDKIFVETGGSLNASDVSFDLTYTVSTIPIENGVTEPRSYFDGWNLIGNPYTSSVDWDLVTLSGIESGIYYLDGGNYKYYIQSGDGSQNPPYNVGISVNGGSRYIPASQGFMVKVNNTGVLHSASLIIPKSARIHQSQTLYKNNVTIPNLLRIELEKDGYSDESVLRTLPYEVSDEFDKKYDLYKMFSFNNSFPQIYTLNNGKTISYALNSIPEITGERIIPIGIYTGKAGNYTIRITENNFNEMNVVLYDKLLNQRVISSENNSYGFKSEQGKNNDRFELVISKKASNISDLNTDITVFPNPVTDNLFIHFSDDFPKEYQITDITGRLISKGIFFSKINRIKFEPNLKGVFLLQIKMSNDKVVYKKIIAE
ncbi:MAG: T9SS type A sorting domain-containing protein [Chlorobi bacterium]|nr:T9SS type A sorting domain-containing protein [Chlorobiota bacterium]